MRRQKEEGSVLIGVLVMLILASLGALALTITLQNYGQLELKRRDALQAYYAAEAGALEVVGWMNMGGTGAPPSLASLFQQDENGNYSALKARLESGPIDIANVDQQYLPVLPDSEQVRRGRVVGLQILPPEQPDPPIAGLLCSVASVGEATRLRSQARVTLYLTHWATAIDGALAAVMCEVAVIGGNTRIHWGEAWTRRTIEGPDLPQTPTEQEDEWVRYRASEVILFRSTWAVPKWGKPYTKDKNLYIVLNTDQPVDGVTWWNLDYEHGDQFWQHQDLQWPNFDYDEIKRIAMKYGRYYLIDWDGSLYRSGIKDKAHLVKNPVVELSVPGSRSQWDQVNYDVVFVDWPGRTPPLPDQKLPTLKLSGGGASWKGLYYVCAHFDIAGMGQPSPIPCVNPVGTIYQLPAFLDGLLIVKGAYKGTGNEVIFGALYDERGFSGTGTPDVYFNVKLKDGFPAPIRSEVQMSRWKM